MLFWDTPAETHSALNDLPAALLLFSVLFDLGGWITKKDSLRAAGFWTLIAGAAGAVLAVWSGLQSEDWIEHGSEVHRFIERHETLAISMTIIFLALAGWRIYRKNQPLEKMERRLYTALSVLGVALLFWVGSLGGTIVYRHGAGVPSRVMRSALEDRERGHVHAPGEEHDLEDSDSTGTAAGDDHEHPPDTPDHED